MGISNSNLANLLYELRYEGFEQLCLELMRADGLQVEGGQAIDGKPRLDWDFFGTAPFLNNTRVSIAVEVKHRKTFHREWLRKTQEQSTCGDWVL